MKKYYYAVKEGKTPGIYKTWEECQPQVKGHRGAVYKKFNTYNEAYEFINGKLDNFKLKEQTKKKREDIQEEIEGLMAVGDLKVDEAIAYVDGSFDLENWTFSYGVVFMTDKYREDYSGRDDDEDLAKMRNVSGEIKGAMVAMKIALEKEIDTLYLHFDYMGIEKWAKGEWKTNKEGTKAYKEYYDSIKDKLKVVFIKVSAHSGIEFNEEADRLAKEAILKG